MKRLILIVILALVLTACSASPVTPVSTVDQAAAAPQPNEITLEFTPTPATMEYLNTDYEDAASLRNQLAFGTLQLEGTDQALTPSQAQAILPFWQAIVALSGNTTTVPEELTAVQNQIVESMTPEQLQAIASLKITSADLNAFYAENGIVLPTPVPGVTKVPGSGKDRSPESKLATQTAASALGAVPEGNGQASKTLLFQEVIKLLTERAAE